MRLHRTHGFTTVSTIDGISTLIAGLDLESVGV